MSSEVECTYIGERIVKNTHKASGAELMSSAPPEQGSPARYFTHTDLVASALGACMLAVMSKVAEQNHVDFRDAAVVVEKTMTENPIRIKRLSARFSLSLKYSEMIRKKLELAAHACPVKRSLHPDVEIEMKFFYEK
jgi:putative redox protein